METGQVEGGDAARLRALQRYGILDSEEEPAFDDLAELAAHVAAAPVSFINFVARDRTWSKARFGTRLVNIPRALSPCSIAMLGREPYAIEDFRKDPRYRDHPLVVGEPHFRAYLAAPLHGVDAEPLGTVCALDFVPHSFETRHARGLGLVAARVRALLEARRQLHEQIGALRDAVAFCDRDWQVVALSPAASELLGAPPGRSRALAELLPEGILRAVHECATAGHPCQSAPMSLGRRRFRLCVYPAPGGRLVAFQDLTAALTESEARRTEHQLLNALFASSQDAISAKDLKGRYLLANDAAAARLGSRPSAILGRTDVELGTAEQAQARVTRDLAVIAGGRTATFECGGADSRTWLTSTGVLRDGQGKVMGVFEVGRDITDRKRAQHELAVTAERLRLAVEAGNLGVWDFDPARRSLWLTGPMQALLGMASGEALDESALLSRVVAEDREAVRQALGRDGDVRVDFRVRLADGRTRWLRARGGPVSDGARRQAGVVADVTEAREKDEQARRLARLQEEFLGVLGHDLRSPLSAIRIWAGTVEREAETDKVRTAAERIRYSTARMDRMITELLDFAQARLGSGVPLERRPLDLGELCARVVEELGAAHPGRVRLFREGDLQGQWDASRMAQAVSNLLGNALQHGPTDQPVEVRCTGGTQAVILEVHNGGPPIAPEILSILFEPFRRGGARKDTGGHLGLGLYITREVLRAHGGTIQVRSEAPHGTTFRAELPR